MTKLLGTSLPKVLIATALISSLSLLGNAPLFAAPIKNGDSCSPVGAKFKQAGVNFVCTDSNGTSVWKSKKKATPAAAAQETFVMPKLVGVNLQLAQDTLQSKGSYLMDQKDHKGLSRLQIFDSNWKVCAQSPAAGKKVPTSTIVVLSSVKLSESC